MWSWSVKSKGYRIPVSWKRRTVPDPVGRTQQKQREAEVVNIYGCFLHTKHYLKYSLQLFWVNMILRQNGRKLGYIIWVLILTQEPLQNNFKSSSPAFSKIFQASICFLPNIPFFKQLTLLSYPFFLWHNFEFPSFFTLLWVWSLIKGSGVRTEAWDWSSFIMLSFLFYLILFNSSLKQTCGILIFRNAKRIDSRG